MRGIRKRFVGLLTVVATVALAFGLVTPALAATITINQPEDGHKYTAYQVLDGTVTEDANHTNVRLSNVQWGNDINGTELMRLLRSSNEAVYAATDSTGVKKETDVRTVFASAQTAEDFAAVFDWASDNSALAQAVANIIDANSATVIKGNGVQSSAYTDGHYTLDITDPGYYFIKDTGDKAGTPSVFVQIFNDAKEIAPKNATPTLEKKVKENSKYNTNGGYGTGYNDTADYNIGDAVPFKLIGNIPDMSAYNNGYQYTIVDTLSQSLDVPDASSVRVFLANDKNVEVDDQTPVNSLPAGVVEVTSQFSATADANAHTLTVQPNIAGSTSQAGTNDLKQVSGVTDYKYVIVAYRATLNNKAVLGQGTIDNNLGDNIARGNVNKALLDYSNNPSFPDAEHQDHTTPDYVIVFTYGTDLTKASASEPNTKLQGVTFRLYRMNGQTKEYAIVNTDHKLGVVNADTQNTEYWTTDENHANVLLTSDANGNFKVGGLDDGTYYVEEVNPANGYNKPGKPWTITINADTGNTEGTDFYNPQDGNGAVSELHGLAGTVANDSYASPVVAFRGATSQSTLVSGTVSGTASDGQLSATILNTQGFQLPQTGGAGTIALTTAGIALVAVVLVVMSIRKRANDEQ